jgi:CheY-like chemotaxis protein
MAFLDISRTYSAAGIKFSDRKAFQYPTFLMTDLNMPAGNGLSVLEHVRRNPG